ncbi:hypothetical protein ACPA2M_13065 [Ectopseudomonas chengduensis]
MPTPNHPKLPLCDEFAAQPDRFMFAGWLSQLQTVEARESQLLAMGHLAGMLGAYQEMRVITLKQNLAMYDELHAYVFGATA